MGGRAEKWEGRERALQDYRGRGPQRVPFTHLLAVHRAKPPVSLAARVHCRPASTRWVPSHYCCRILAQEIKSPGCRFTDRSPKIYICACQMNPNGASRPGRHDQANTRVSRQTKGKFYIDSRSCQCQMRGRG